MSSVDEVPTQYEEMNRKE